jgi:hypothetical protein
MLPQFRIKGFYHILYLILNKKKRLIKLGKFGVYFPFSAEGYPRHKHADNDSGDYQK